MRDRIKTWPSRVKVLRPVKQPFTSQGSKIKQHRKLDRVRLNVLLLNYLRLLSLNFVLL